MSDTATPTAEPEVIGSDSAQDLARAMSDLENMDPAPKPEPKPEKKPKQEGESSGSGLLDTMKSYSFADEGGDQGDSAGDPAPEGASEEGETPTAEVEGYEEVDTNIPASQTIKGKFKRFKENEKALKSAVEAARQEAAEARKQAAEASEAMKGLQTADAERQPLEAAPEHQKALERIQELEDTLSRVRLEESPAFKRKYDGAINAAFQKAKPFILSIKDEQSRTEVGRAIDEAMQMRDEVAFYDRITTIIENSEIRDSARQPLHAKLVAMKEAVDAKDAALADWKKESENISAEDSEFTESKAKEAGIVVDRIRNGYETSAADRIGVYRRENMKAVLDYDGIVGPRVAKIKEEAEKSARVGAPTPELIDLANQGAELDYQIQLNAKYAVLTGNLNAQLTELKEKLSKYEKSGSRSNGGPSGKESKKEEKSEYGILDTMKNRR